MSTDKSFMAFWAKKAEKEGKFYWLPLSVHLTDTKNVIRWLWMNWLSDRQREFCVRSLSPSTEEAAVNTAAFLGAVHDIGKATPAFQQQKGFSNSPDLDNKLLEKLERAGFRGISHHILSHPKKSHHSIAGEYLLKSKFLIKDDIGSIIGGHHGKPVDESLYVDDQSAYPENYFQSEDKDSEIYLKWSHAQDSIFRQALDMSGFHSAEELPEISEPAQVIYCGLLIMADWISSNSDFFPLIDVDSDNIPDSAERFISGIKAWGGNLPLQISTYPSMDELFVRRFEFLPRDFQRTVYQTVGRIQTPGIIILEAPMGVGKTEAALAAAEETAAKTGNSGLFFGLPTQATSNGMFGRVHHWLKTLTSEYDVSQSLRLCHGKAALNDEMSKLRSASYSCDINIDEDENGSVYVNEWFSGRKKTSLDDFVVGTVDGFLLTALKQKHLALRHLGFSKKVVIIDEVHAYDAYMQQYLEEAIRWMGAYGTPVILASATLPQERREKLIAAYLKGTGMKNRDMVFPREMSGSYYPLISYTDGKKVKVQTKFASVEDKKVRVVRMDEAQLPDQLDELLKEGGVAGIIVNTVRRAQDLGRMCKERYGKDTVDVLHSSFIATDRVKKESDLMRMIGKGGQRPKRKIIIGTQVIEQSLDIDFDVLITDLCPIDLLLQRIGRLHRHEIERPKKHREPVVYVLGTNEKFKFEKGSIRVYEEWFLIRTQYYLPDVIRIPSDIPILINKVYGDEDPDFQGELLNIYEKSRETMDLHKKNKADKAITYRLDHPDARISPQKNNLIGWLRDPDRSNSEEMAAAQVRDIMETIEVIAVRKTECGYGTFYDGKDISGKIEEPAIAKKLARQTIRLPNSITARKGVSEIINYLETYNRKHLANWQNQPWLKGTLGIIFDEEGRFNLDGVVLKYDNEYGLREEKRDGKI